MTNGFSLLPSIAAPRRSAFAAAMLGAATAAVLTTIFVPARAQPAASAGVSIDNFTFAPESLTINAGTTVTWLNEDDIPHGIASSNNDFAKSKALDTDDSYSFTFVRPGTYRYFCYLHPHMTGTIVVKADNN